MKHEFHARYADRIRAVLVCMHDNRIMQRARIEIAQTPTGAVCNVYCSAECDATIGILRTIYAGRRRNPAARKARHERAEEFL